jgi:hypothetical protein
MHLGVQTVGGKIDSNPIDPSFDTIDTQIESGFKTIHPLGKHLLALGEQVELVAEGILQRADPTCQQFIDLLQKLLIHLPPSR